METAFVFPDETTQMLVRAALELALAEGRRVQVAFRGDGPPTAERPKVLAVVTAIAPDLHGVPVVTLRADDGTTQKVPVDRIYGVKRI